MVVFSANFEEQSAFSHASEPKAPASGMPCYCWFQRVQLFCEMAYGVLHDSDGDVEDCVRLLEELEASAYKMLCKWLDEVDTIICQDKIKKLVGFNRLAAYEGQVIGELREVVLAIEK